MAAPWTPGLQLRQAEVELRSSSQEWPPVCGGCKLALYWWPARLATTNGLNHVDAQLSVVLRGLWARWGGGGGVEDWWGGVERSGGYL